MNGISMTLRTNGGGDPMRRCHGFTMDGLGLESLGACSGVPVHGDK